MSTLVALATGVMGTPTATLNDRQSFTGRAYRSIEYRLGTLDITSQVISLRRRGFISVWTKPMLNRFGVLCHITVLDAGRDYLAKNWGMMLQLH